MSYYTNNSSPPPLQHPVPTHPAYIPEPPSTPMSPQGYQRYTSSPSAPGYAQPMPNAGHPSHISPPYGAGGAYQPAHQPHPQMNPAAPVDFSAWGLDNATAAFGMQLGQSAVAAGQEYVQKNVCLVLPVSSVDRALMRVFRSVRVVDPDIHAQAPLQRLQLVCHQEAPHSALPLEA